MLKDERECDKSKVVVKTYWSWQGVHGLLGRRKAMLSSGLLVGRGRDGIGMMSRVGVFHVKAGRDARYKG